MMNRYLFFFSIAIALNISLNAYHIKVSKSDAKKIGEKIWKNESAGKIEGLTFWKDGEQWASVGIGHFIWHPENNVSNFNECLPSLIKFIQNKRYPIPGWLLKENNSLISCPWSTRDEFLDAFNSKKMLELRQFFFDTIDLQTEFIIKRLSWAIHKILSGSKLSKRAGIKVQFKRMAETNAGLYALIDYLNFKGEGLQATENYNNKRWGLLQVLEKMHEKSKNESIKSSKKSAIKEFADCAKEVLTERVENSPKERNEDRWLQGWKNRIDSYLNFE